MQAETFDSRDLDRIEAFVSGLYSRMRIGAVGEDTRARIDRRLLTPEAGFDDLEYGFHIGYAAEPPDLLIVCDVIAGTIRSDHGGSAETFGPGDQFLISRPGLPYSGVAYAPTLRFTVLHPAVLARAAGGPVRVLDHRPASPPARYGLNRAVSYVRDEVLAALGGPATPLLAAAASHLLAAAVLEAYPSTAVTEPTAQDRNDAGPTTLQRAVAFIESHADRELALIDIARAAYVTPRALQLAFRHHLGTTPLAYLRRVRLDHAHGELRAATAGDGTTVTAVAARWGFTPSRFSRQYRAAYGRAPGATLHE